MTREFNVKYLHKGEISSARIIVSQVEKGKNLLEYFDNSESWNDKDELLFCSFCKLRKYLEAKDKILLCKGCRINVHPAGGSRLAWFYAMVLTKGLRFDRVKDQVVIFDEELEIDQIVSVEEQEKFYREWWKSVTGNSIDPKPPRKSIFSTLKNWFNKKNKLLNK